MLPRSQEIVEVVCSVVHKSLLIVYLVDNNQLLHPLTSQLPQHKVKKELQLLEDYLVEAKRLTQHLPLVVYLEVAAQNQQINQLQLQVQEDFLEVVSQQIIPQNHLLDYLVETLSQQMDLLLLEDYLVDLNLMQTNQLQLVQFLEELNLLKLKVFLEQLDLLKPSLSQPRLKNSMKKLTTLSNQPSKKMHKLNSSNTIKISAKRLST